MSKGPVQVSKIVLAATQPGTGDAVAAGSSNPGAVISVLFPPSDIAAAHLFQDMASFLPVVERFLR